eukprot:748476-Hanusia_phi.AAC.2
MAASRQYGVKDGNVLGIRGGFKGFLDPTLQARGEPSPGPDPLVCPGDPQPGRNHSWIQQVGEKGVEEGGRRRLTSEFRGGFDCERIVDEIERWRFWQAGRRAERRW